MSATPLSQRTGRTAAVPVAPKTGRLQPLGSDEVHITGGFWASRQRVNASNTLSHIGYWLEREGWIDNFRLADRSRPGGLPGGPLGSLSGSLPEGRRGREFSDSEIYKYLEAMAWEIGRTGDLELEHRFRALVDVVAAAQEPDGYLNTCFGRPGQRARWSDLEWGHELYCLGHLIQAAVARARTRPGTDDSLLVVARRAADLVCEVFSPQGRAGVCGHPEIETALAELARVTEEPRYLEQAAVFIARRGTGTLRQIELGQQYFQDDLPVHEAKVLRGHAVRANYLSAGAVDVAVDTDDTRLLTALENQWRTTVARRTYVTGGQGSRHQDEGFGDDFELPCDRAYSETCAGIGSIMFSWRLLLARGDANVADLIERTLYNVVATSPSEDGTAFYYSNTLHQRQPGSPAASDEVSHRASSSLRAAWFDVSCCPPNVARTLASLDTLIATVDSDGLQLQQYATCTVRTRLGDGTHIAVDVETHYPTSGTVQVTVVEGSNTPWTLSMRVPAWVSTAALDITSVSGQTSGTEHGPGWVSVRRAFAAGDIITLRIPLQPRVTEADPRIDAVRGCVTVELGPQVFCLESVDLAEATRGAVTDVADVEIDLSRPPILRAGQLLVWLAPTVELASEVPSSPGLFAAAAWPYGPPRATVVDENIEVPLIPYNGWAERGPSTMRVWIPVRRSRLVPEGLSRNE